MAGDPGVEEGVGLTALMVAAARAIETHRHDALIRGLDADGIWMATKGHGRRMVVHATPGLNWDPDPGLAALTSRNSARYWAEGTYSIISRQDIADSADWNDQAAVADKWLHIFNPRAMDGQLVCFSDPVERVS